MPATDLNRLFDRGTEAFVDEAADLLAAELHDDMDGFAGFDLEADEQPIGPEDTRRRILSTGKIPFRYICKLEGPDGGATGNCTGTLIGSDKVLTAAHCVRDVKSTPAVIRVIPGKRRSGSSRSAEPFGFAMGRRVDMPAGHHLAGDRFDYAVITLDRHIGRRTGWWRRIAAWSDDRVRVRRANIAGFPRDKHARGDHMYWTFNSFVSVTGARMEYLHDTERGMSGSPLWIRWRNARTIIGVHSARDDGVGVVANRGVHITAGILSEIRGWL
jgi:V8-like Glu-specific endopeptidase